MSASPASAVRGVSKVPSHGFDEYISLKDRQVLLDEGIVAIKSQIDKDEQRKIETLQKSTQRIDKEFSGKHKGENAVLDDKHAYEVEELRKKHVTEKKELLVHTLTQMCDRL
jgi:hypothetical protein